MKTRSELEAVATIIVSAAVRVHSSLGPGLLESAYQACLAHELRKRGLRVRCEVVMPVRYAGVDVDAGYRLDMLIEEVIVIENKAVQELLPIHEAQLITYLKLSGCKIGFLLNWNVKMMKEGINRYVNRL
ncbi:MAG: GxxExxY protein [Caldilineaceae bacterium]